MTICFENENDVIVYVLENIITYAKDNRYIFLAQCVWWISLIIGLQQELIRHIDNLKKELEITEPFNKEVSATPRDLQEENRLKNDSEYVHPDRINQIEITILNQHDT
jgi:hypothetical protein